MIRTFFKSLNFIDKLIVIFFVLFVLIILFFNVSGFTLKPDNMPKGIWEFFSGFYLNFMLIMGMNIPWKLLKEKYSNKQNGIPLENSSSQKENSSSENQIDNILSTIFLLFVSLILLIFACFSWYASWVGETGLIFGIGWTIAGFFFNRIITIIEKFEEALKKRQKGKPNTES